MQVLFHYLPPSVAEGNVTGICTCKCVTEHDRCCWVIWMEISGDVEDQKFIVKFMAVKSSVRCPGRHWQLICAILGKYLCNSVRIHWIHWFAKQHSSRSWSSATSGSELPRTHIQIRAWDSVVIEGALESGLKEPLEGVVRINPWLMRLLKRSFQPGEIVTKEIDEL